MYFSFLTDIHLFLQHDIALSLHFTSSSNIVLYFSFLIQKLSQPMMLDVIMLKFNFFSTIEGVIGRQEKFLILRATRWIL